MELLPRVAPRCVAQPGQRQWPRTKRRRHVSVGSRSVSERLARTLALFGADRSSPTPRYAGIAGKWTSNERAPIASPRMLRPSTTTACMVRHFCAVDRFDRKTEGVIEAHCTHGESICLVNRAPRTEGSDGHRESIRANPNRCINLCPRDPCHPIPVPSLLDSSRDPERPHIPRPHSAHHISAAMTRRECACASTGGPMHLLYPEALRWPPHARVWPLRLGRSCRSPPAAVSLDQA
ncbi:unnamed protein product [Mycena citricolor]|uniref:Uncharacterized protein n=1 Tax=Mycena citricolor TaxID=2018698 RepID=A0AAD2GYK7_9AGAR|nr:unnamed protein product [Mycena citricolor]